MQGTEATSHLFLRFPAWASEMLFLPQSWLHREDVGSEVSAEVVGGCKGPSDFKAPPLTSCSSGHSAVDFCHQSWGPIAGEGCTGLCKPTGLRRGQRVKREWRFLKTHLAYSLVTGWSYFPTGPFPSLSTETGDHMAASAYKVGFLGDSHPQGWAASSEVLGRLKLVTPFHYYPLTIIFQNNTI